MKRFGWIVMSMVAALALSASAGQGKAKGQDAQQAGPKSHRFAEADADQDGKLSPAEFATMCKGGKAEDKFAAADTDKDGFLTKEELRAAHASHGGHGSCPKKGGAANS